MILILLMLVIYTESARSDTLFVDSTLQLSQVIAEALPGDVLILDVGTHVGPIIPYSKSLTIGSRYLLDGSAEWIAQTNVTASDNNPDSASAVIVAYGEPSCRLTGLTLTGASGTLDPRYGGTAGGCIYVNHSNLAIDHCRITGGSADNGGGIFVSGGWWEWETNLTVLSTTIDSCLSQLQGGGIYADFCTLAVSKTIFRDLLSNGGAAGFHENDCYITIDSSEFTNCRGGVGGITLYGGWGTVTGSNFHENSTPWNGFCNDLSANDFTGEIRGCWFHDTHALWPSVHLGRIYGAVTFIGNVLENNSTSDITGTLIVNGDSDYTISHNLFRDNHNVGGGAVYAFAYATAIVELNSFVGNSSDDPTRGSVLESVNHGAPSFRDNIVAGNFGKCVNSYHDFRIVLDARNNWWGHESGPYHAELNPLGQGDTLVGDSVLFEPWLTSPPDTTQPSAIRPEPERPVVGTWDLQSVFPNPFNNAFTLSLAGFAGRAFEISLFDILGRRVATLHSGPALGGLFTFTVSPELSSGVYFVAAHDDIVRESIKVVLLK